MTRSAFIVTPSPAFAFAAASMAWTAVIVGPSPAFTFNDIKGRDGVAAEEQHQGDSQALMSLKAKAGEGPTMTAVQAMLAAAKAKAGEGAAMKALRVMLAAAKNRDATEKTPKD
ncbi:uncharacterized protein B0H64DRAFT_378123 [Chaetomium fimeti]|uniref:Uncharacterized protein n=1 Tax=Chaetomium fimeti TaxID=1854472 RepID=A0AAE0LMZ0_9PEZI|nr:hypothetical protein B0H64DRAFT_378123 [Chaetomium fimeti]